MNQNWTMALGRIGGWVLGVFGIACAAVAAPLYENDFSKAEVGKVPDDFLVLDGQFAVQQANDAKYLELPGAPLETFGLLFGPSRQDGLAVSVRIQATGAGRRFPVFAVSLGGVSGFKLQLSPAKKAVELVKGDAVIATKPFEWRSGEWFQLRLQLRKTGEKAWALEGKAWPHGTTEPSGWTITIAVAEEPVAGKPGIWGKPFSGTPIRFDDLIVAAASGG